MTELTLKLDDELALRFKEISLKKFHGDETLAFEHALKYLLSEEDREMLRFEQIVEQIQDEIETAGGITEKEIDAFIAAYRHDNLNNKLNKRPMLFDSKKKKNFKFLLHIYFKKVN